MTTTYFIFHIIPISQVIQDDLPYEQWKADKFRLPGLAVIVAITEVRSW